jgi:hypothetical protein
LDLVTLEIPYYLENLEVLLILQILELLELLDLQRVHLPLLDQYPLLVLVNLGHPENLVTLRLLLFLLLLELHLLLVTPVVLVVPEVL